MPVGISGDARPMVRAALLYYREGATQAQVADRLGVSRATAGRLLARARSSGVVRIEIVSTMTRAVEVEIALEERYSLVEAVVSEPLTDDRGEVDLGRGCADVLTRRLHPGMVLGLGWSEAARRTALALAAAEPRMHLPDVTVVQLAGALSSTPGRPNPTRTVTAVADALSATEVLVAAPLYVDQASTAVGLLNDRGVRDAFATAGRADICLFGIGDVSRTTPLFVNGYLDGKTLDELVSLGAVGDLGGRFFDDSGCEVASTLTDRTISVPLTTVVRAPLRIAVAAGSARIPALRSAIRGGLANALVTDLSTALGLLDRSAP